MKINSSKETFTRGFRTEEECLDILFQMQYGQLETCPSEKCKAPARFHPVKGRKCYECGSCGHQLYPMKGTIMESSKLPLYIWFQLLRDFVANSDGVTSTYLEQRYGLATSNAQLILRRIRYGLHESVIEPLTGVIEMDELFLGGHRPLVPGTDKRGVGKKFIVLGFLQRDGRLVMFHVASKDAKTLRPLIDSTVAKGATIHHDGNSTYGNLRERGFVPRLVPKKGTRKFNGRDGLHNNNIEGAWSRLQVSLYKCRGVSAQHLQSYLDEFCFRQRNRGQWIKDNPMEALFRIVLGRYPNLESPSEQAA